jgi:hypothetical protein
MPFNPTKVGFMIPATLSWMAKETGQPQAKLGGMTAEMWFIVTEIFTVLVGISTVDVRIKIELGLAVHRSVPEPEKARPASFWGRVFLNCGTG